MAELTPETFLDEIERVAKTCYELRDRALAELPATIETAVCMGSFGAILAILEQLVSAGPPRPQPGETHNFAPSREETMIDFRSPTPALPEQTTFVERTVSRLIALDRVQVPTSLAFEIVSVAAVSPDGTAREVVHDQTLVRPGERLRVTAKNKGDCVAVFSCTAFARVLKEENGS
jgi:hypothetical protein